jgi:hypothetical protein
MIAQNEEPGSSGVYVADDAGALLVRSGLVSGTALDSARALAAQHGGTLGEHLVATGAVSDDALTEFYRSRLLVPQVNPNSLAKLKAKVVQAIPADMAVELRAVPVAFDADGNLTVAMGDPSDRHAVDEITFFTGNYVVRAVATQMQIAWCLAHYYGHVTELGQRLLQPKDGDEAVDDGDDDDDDLADEPATAAAAAPAAPAVPLPTRARGDTARVQAARHRVLPPVTVPPPLARPSVDVLDRSTPAPPGSPPDTRTTVPDLEAARIAAGPPPPEPPATPVRSRTASGEIPIRSLPRSADTETSDPEITITGNVEETTSPGTRAPRTRIPDPPELAERGGEIAGRDAGSRTVAEEPRVVIDLDALKPSREAPILRSGEIRLPRERAASIPPMVTDEPSVKVSLEPDEPPAVIHDTRRDMDAVVVEDASDLESAPILLERLRTIPPVPAAAPAAVAAPPPADDDTDVVLLQPRRPRTTSEKRRLARHTQLGMGRAGTGDERARRDTGVDRASRDTEVGGLPPGADMMMSQIIMIAPDAGTTTEEPATTQVTVTSSDADDAIVIAAAAPDETVVTTAAPVHEPDPDATSDGTDADEDDDDDDEVAEPPRAVSEDTVTTTRAAPAPPASSSADDTDDDGRTTDVHPAIPGSPPARPASRRTAPALAIDHDAVDDGWGPPGTTIPPPFVGAAIDDSQPLARIPIADADSAPIVVAPPITRGADAAAAARDLETAATRLVTVLRDIDTAKGRDEVIYNLINHLGETHNRAAFLAVKNGELIVFSVRAPAVAQPRLTLSLDLPSTFQDVVGTRLPYRGPVVDEPTRHYLQGLLGTAPAEMLVIPVAVRDRVVGVLYADGRRRQTFDDHYAIAARAAGLALERILSTAKRATEPPATR